mgnify:CR=1 FL=1
MEKDDECPTRRLILGGLFYTGETHYVELKQVTINTGILEMAFAPRPDEQIATALHVCEPLNNEESGNTEMIGTQDYFLATPPSVANENETITERETITILDFLSLIKPSLELFLDWTFPKYFSCFCNSQTNGDLYLGIADDLEIVGIPLFKGLSVSYMTEYLMDVCRRYVKPEDSERFDIERMFEVTIIPLETQMELLRDDIQTVMDDYANEKVLYNDRTYEYARAYREWSAELGLVSGKLLDIVNTTPLRRGMIAFMYQHKNEWTESTAALVKRLGEFKYVHFDTVHERFASVREDASKIWFWVTRFKESMVSEISKRKPIKPKMSTKIPITVAVSRLSDLRFRYCRLGVDYVVIKIHIKGGCQISSDTKCFKDSEKIICDNSTMGFCFPDSNIVYKKKRCVDVLGDPYSCSLTEHKYM